MVIGVLCSGITGCGFQGVEIITRGFEVIDFDD